MVYGVIGLYTSATFDYNATNWKLGGPWKEEYWTQSTYLNVEVVHMETHGPSAGDFQFLLFRAMWIFVFLWWYQDHVLASNRGYALPFYFPFTKSYWLSVFPCFGKEDDRLARERRKKRVLKESDLE